MKIGTYNQLEVLRDTSVGLFLGDESGNEVLLPNKYVPANAKIGKTLDVFVYMDSEDRPIATTLRPFIQLGEFACLRVKDVSGVGAFLDWGLEKDLLVPFREQKDKMRVGKSYIVYLRLDEVTQRLVATAKLHKVFDKATNALEEGQEVDLIIGEGTEIGIEVVINHRYRGMLYRNEIFQDVMFGDPIKGFIKQVREDGKIDVSLRKTGMDNLEEGAQKILDELKANDGYLPLHDKSDPEDIQFQLEMSKKNFKRSLGTLYKKKLVVLEKDGVRLK
ncbi:MAG: S1-like domain-containing RNA-binding protein [Cytophagales bacterium]|nr:S1-like domain-containing RNA-binding protein [Cytophagales bacterium]